MDLIGSPDPNRDPHAPACLIGSSQSSARAGGTSHTVTVRPLHDVWQ
jgi:hypothetical protein